RLGRERGPDARRAVDDDRGRLVGDPALDGALEVPPRQVQRAGDGPLLVLFGLPHVEDDGAAGGAGRLRRLGVDLADLRLGGGEELSEAGHGRVSVRAGDQKATGWVNYRPTPPIPGSAHRVEHRARGALGDL